MSFFYMTPEIRAKRGKMLLEMLLLKGKEKIFGKLSEKEEKRRQEILREFCRHY